MQSNFLAQKIWTDTKLHYCPPSTVLSSWKSPPLSAFHSLTSLGIKCHTSLASNIFACTHSMHWIKLNCNYFLAWVCESSKSVFSSTAWTFIPNGYLDAYEVKVNIDIFKYQEVFASINAITYDAHPFLKTDAWVKAVFSPRKRRHSFRHLSSERGVRRTLWC